MQKINILNAKNIMADIAKNARTASHNIKNINTEQKNKVLSYARDFIQEYQTDILKANELDIQIAKNKNKNHAFIDRLKLNYHRIADICKSLENIQKLEDPIGKVFEKKKLPNGIFIEKVRQPIGVIGMIYESRPNVTIDAAALTLKSGNAVILRCGSEVRNTAQKLIDCFHKALSKADIDIFAAQIIPINDRKCIDIMCSGINNNIDIIIPRGGVNLVKRVMKKARIPVLGHSEGICHVFVEKNAQINMAIDIVINSKMRRTSVCNSLETLLIDQNYQQNYIIKLLSEIKNTGCEIRACDKTRKIFKNLKKATQKDWKTEYGLPILAVKIVDGIEEAMQHIDKYSSKHTDSIITDDQDIADIFCANIDSAVVMHNCSTQFSDGGEFGMGAEIGIATTKIHARGPIGMEQLTCYKYLVRAKGHTRK